MKEIYKGHTYELDNLKDSGVTILRFHMDGDLHGGDKQKGPSTQEVLRACVKRMSALHEEKQHWVNPIVIGLLRRCILLLEVRAAEKQLPVSVAIEDIHTRADGHWEWTIQP